MLDNNCVRQIFKYGTFTILVFLICSLYQVSKETKYMLSIILPTLYLFYDFYVPTYVIKLDD